MEEKKISKDEKIYAMSDINTQEFLFYNKGGANRFVKLRNNMFNISQVCIDFLVYDPNKKSGDKVEEEVNAYIQFEKALLFCDSVLNGEYDKLTVEYYINKLRLLIGQVVQMEKKAKNAGKNDEAAKFKKIIDMAVAVVNSKDINGLEKVINEVSNIKGINKNTGIYPPVLFHQTGGTSAEKLAKQDKSRKDGNALSRQIKLTVGEKKRYILSGESGPGKKDSKGLIIPLYGNKPEHRIMIGFDPDELRIFALVLKAHIEAYLSAKYVKIALGISEFNSPRIDSDESQYVDEVVDSQKTEIVENTSPKEQKTNINDEPTDAEISEVLQYLEESDLPF